MTEKAKNKRALKIADELDNLGFEDIAADLRIAVNSKQKGNASTLDEGGEQEDNEGNGDGGGGGNNPPHKPPFK